MFAMGRKPARDLGAVDPPRLPESLARWTGNLLWWASRVGARHYARALEPLGLEPREVAVLQLLEGEGPYRQGLAADLLGLDRATMVKVTHSLLGLGLVARTPEPNDRRALTLSLTAKGEATVAQIAEVTKRADETFFGVLSIEERSALRSALLRISEAREPR